MQTNLSWNQFDFTLHIQFQLDVTESYFVKYRTESGCCSATILHPIFQWFIDLHLFKLNIYIFDFLFSLELNQHSSQYMFYVDISRLRPVSRLKNTFLSLTLKFSSFTYFCTRSAFLNPHVFFYFIKIDKFFCTCSKYL